MNEEVRRRRNDDGYEALLDEISQYIRTIELVYILRYGRKLGRDETYNDKYPSPTSIPTHSIHESYSVCQNAAKCTCQRSGREEECNTVVGLSALVPHGQIEHHSREETTLRHSQEESRRNQASEALRNTHESGNDTPQEHQGWQPELRGRALEDDVAGNFEEDLSTVDPIIRMDLHF